MSYYPPYPYPVHNAPAPATQPLPVMQSAAMGATVGAAAATARQLRQPVRSAEAAVGEILAAGAVTGVTTATLTYMRQHTAHPSSFGTFATLFMTGTALMVAFGPRSGSNREERG